MYKELVICFIIIFGVIVVDVITQNYTKNSVEVMDSKLEALKEELEKDESQIEKDKLQINMEEIIKIWREKYEKLAYFIEHDELEKVETELTSLKAHIDIEEYDHGVPELEKSIFILNHIKEKFKVDIKNIF